MPEKVAVVTGASSGIGASLARQLSAKGYGLVLAARRERELGTVARQSGANALAVVMDLTRRSNVEHLREVALKEFGHVDVWVNNAGRGINKPVMDLTDGEFDEIVNVVLRSVLYGMQTIIPHFKARQKGHLINVSSALGRVPLLPHRSIYSASQSAVNSLTSNLRMDLKADDPGIHVSTVMPGAVDTDFHRIAGPGLPVRAGGFIGPTRVESADEVAAKIISLLDNPVAELYTSPTHLEMVERYFHDVGAFEQSSTQRPVARP